MKKYNLLNDVIGWVCFVIAAITYLLTIEPTASFWDCPEFISQGAKLEVGHPPGNPIFMLTARFFVTLFGNDIANAAIAVNSMSALLSAATILLLFWTITHLVRRLIVRDDATTVTPWQMALIFGGGICGALGYAWSDTFWFSAVEGEVYAFSSFCTALVFWLILKWENRADQPHSDRYLILIAYVIGVSIAVHLLNLLCIPAIVLVFYYKKFKNTNAKGSLLALLVSFVIVGLILYGLVPGFVKVAQWFELLFINGFGCAYNTGVIVYAALLVATFIWAISALYKQNNPTAIKWSFFLSIVLSGMPFIGSVWIALVLTIALAVYLFGFCSKIPVRIFNVVVLSVFLIFVGYSSYALLLIRSHANTPMNQNAPDNVFALGSYLNREQYGDRPLFYGSTFAEELDMEEYPAESGNYFVYVDNNGYPTTHIIDGVLRDEDGAPYADYKTSYGKVVKTNPNQPDQYVEGEPKPDYTEIPGTKMLFPRIYSSDRIAVSGYKGWSQYTTPDIYEIPAEVRQKWAQQGYAPLYEIAPYLNSQKRVPSAIDHSGNEVDHMSVWVPGFTTNMRYFFNYQFSHMYWRYFMWNFAGRQNDLAGNGEPHLGNWISGIPFIDNARLGDQSLLPDEFGKGNKGHNVFYMLPLLLGIIGLLWQALYIKPDAPQRGIEQFWVVCFLFFMTGIAIVLYLNQTPGQPRERDYAFAGSFYAFAIWMGIAVPAIGMMLRKLFERKGKTASKGALISTAAVAALIGILVPLQMVSQTWDDHDRSGRYTTRDFGFNYLASVDENGIIFCNGDNDTFPLWYAQEVEGFRTDVRVVNLSYLTTDWYANQQRIPSYEAAAIDMYASPATYGNDRLAYSFVVMRDDSLITVEDALNELYQSKNVYKQNVLTRPNVFTQMNLDDAIKHYGIDTTRTADRLYAMPYLTEPKTNLSEYMRRYGKSGLNLGNVLALDIIANSVEQGFKRPVYFASTVPSSYYLGLDPYINSTGMAYEVTPFNSAPVSPIVDKAYENIVGKFRWGGLDIEHPEKLYLDETVRRMVSSTRSTILATARDLIASGELPASKWAIEHAKATNSPVPATRADMARILLNLIVEKLPAKAAPFSDVTAVLLAGAYYDIYVLSNNPADLDAAMEITNIGIESCGQFTRYAQSLTPSQLNLIGDDINQVDYLSMLIGLKNRIETVRALEKDTVKNAEILEKWRTRPSTEIMRYVSQYLYVEDFSLEELQSSLDKVEGATYTVVNEAILTIQAHQAAGTDVKKISNEVMQQYGINAASWSNLLRY